MLSINNEFGMANAVFLTWFKKLRRFVYHNLKSIEPDPNTTTQILSINNQYVK